MHSPSPRPLADSLQDWSDGTTDGGWKQGGVVVEREGQPVRMAMDDISSIVCPIQRAATLVADVVVIVILRELQDGPKRFGHFIGVGINPRSLSKRLQRLVDEEIVTRTSYAQSPPRVEYALTDKGRAVAPVLHALQEFGEAWLPCRADDPERFQEAVRKP